MYGANSIIPLTQDAIFIRDHLGITSGFGYMPVEGSTTEQQIIYPIDRYEDVQALLADYDAVYHQVVTIPAAIIAIRQLRKAKMAAMTFEVPGVGAMRLSLDDQTMFRLLQAKALLDEAIKRGDPLEEIDWELTEGNFVTWPAQLIQDAAYFSGRHVQACFTHQKNTYAAARATVDGPSLVALNINAGWPNE